MGNEAASAERLLSVESSSVRGCAPQEVASCRVGEDHPGRRVVEGLPAWVAASRGALPREGDHLGVEVPPGRMVVVDPQVGALQQAGRL